MNLVENERCGHSKLFFFFSPPSLNKISRFFPPSYLYVFFSFLSLSIFFSSSRESEVSYWTSNVRISKGHAFSTNFWINVSRKLDTDVDKKGTIYILQILDRPMCFIIDLYFESRDKNLSDKFCFNLTMYPSFIEAIILHFILI